MRQGQGTGHPQSDADEAAPQLDRLSGTCSYQIKRRPQEQQSHGAAGHGWPAPPCLPSAGSGAGAPLPEAAASGQGLGALVQLCLRVQSDPALQGGFKREGSITYTERCAGVLSQGLWASFVGSMSPEVTGKTRVCTHICNLPGKWVHIFHQTFQRILEPSPESQEHCSRAIFIVGKVVGRGSPEKMGHTLEAGQWGWLCGQG